MTAVNLAPELIAEIVAAGWIDKGIHEPKGLPVVHVFEAPARALVLTVAHNFANVDSSYFHYGTRKRFPAEPTIYPDFASTQAAAFQLRSDLAFLPRQGIKLAYASLHRISKGSSFTGWRQSKTCTGIYIGRGQ